MLGRREAEVSESDRPRSAAEFAKVQEAYGGKYVATRGDQVIANAETCEELFRTLDARDDYKEDVVVAYVRPKGVVWCPTPFVVREAPPVG